MCFSFCLLNSVTPVCSLQPQLPLRQLEVALKFVLKCSHENESVAKKVTYDLIVIYGYMNFLSGFCGLMLFVTTKLGNVGSHGTVRHTHPVELPRWAQRQSHASELPSHSIYCKEKYRNKSVKGNLIRSSPVFSVLVYLASGSSSFLMHLMLELVILNCP